MTKPIVFVDTNTIDNKCSAKNFLGGRPDLEKIGRRADIALPRVVYDELCRHIYSYLDGQKKSLWKNPHRYLLEIGDDAIKNIDPRRIITNLIKQESIVYSVIDLVDKEAAYEEIYKHAIEGSPPFEKGGDKGFKDTLIAKTIDQYILANPNQKIFLMTKDDRLKEYFNENKRIVIISDYDDFDREYSDDKLSEEGLIERLRTYLQEVGLSVADNRLPERSWLNYEGNIVAYFNDVDEESIYLLIDSTAREPISFIKGNIDEDLVGLEKVSSFAHAHIAIGEIDRAFDYYDIDGIKRIVHAMTSNDQIYSIGNDDDISQFALRLFTALSENGEPKLTEALASMYKLSYPAANTDL